MVSNRIILGAVAFGVSFGISFLSNRNANRALLTGLITLPATYAAAIVVDKRHRNRELLILLSQRQQIHELEAQEINLNRILSNTSLKKQELENSINYLQTESNQLRSQFAAAHKYKDDLQRELTSLKDHSEKNLESLHTEIYNLEHQKLTLAKSISAITVEKKALEDNTDALRSELAQLHEYLTEKSQQKEALNQEISNLNNQQSVLLSKLDELNNQVCTLATNYTNKNQEVAAKISELQLEFTKLNKQVTQQQSEKEAIEEDLQIFKEQRRQIELKIYILQNQTEKLEHHKNDIQHNLTSLKVEKEEIQANLDSLKLKKEQQQAELLALQEERNQLQNHILEFHNQIEALISEPSIDDTQQEDTDLFPFAELIDSLETSEVEVNTPDQLAGEWMDFMEQLPGYEIQVLKAILEQDNPSKVIQKIAETKITMPALIVDKINERALDTIGDSIIEVNSEPIEIIEDCRENIRKIIQIYEGIMSS